MTRVANGIAELNADRVRTRANDELPRTPPRRRRRRTVPQRRPEAAARILSELRDVAEVEWLGGGGGRRGVAGGKALASAGIPLSDWLPRAELLDRIGSATVYLHWTAWDGLPLSILEAMALDVVVVASDIPPNREILGPDAVCATEEEAVARVRRVITDPAMPSGYAPPSARGAARQRREHGHGMARGYERLVAARP